MLKINPDVKDRLISATRGEESKPDDEIQTVIERNLSVLLDLLFLFGPLVSFDGNQNCPDGRINMSTLRVVY